MEFNTTVGVPKCFLLAEGFPAFHSLLQKKHRSDLWVLTVPYPYHNIFSHLGLILWAKTYANVIYTTEQTQLLYTSDLIQVKTHRLCIKFGLRIYFLVIFHYRFSLVRNCDL